MRTLCTFIGAYALAMLALVTLAVIATACWRRVSTWRAVRAVIRSSAELPPVPRICLHVNETLDTAFAYKVALRCLDCGTSRIVGDIYFGASNKAKRGAA